MLARTMAAYADPNVSGPVIELGPRTVRAAETARALERRSGGTSEGPRLIMDRTG
jgi:phospholipid N-methyltransferase